jgi:hypothetical protein
MVSPFVGAGSGNAFRVGEKSTNVRLSTAKHKSASGHWYFMNMGFKDLGYKIMDYSYSESSPDVKRREKGGQN